MPVRRPRCAIFSSVPPQVCSTSSRWAAIANTSSAASEAGRVDISVKVSLLQNYVLAHDQTVLSHFFQRGQDAAHMLVSIDEDNYHWEFSSGVDQMAGLHPMPPQKTGHSMDCGCGIYIFAPQIIENLHVQRPVVPLVRFVEIDCDLNCHRVWHFTAPAPVPFRLKLRRGTTGYC